MSLVYLDRLAGLVPVAPPLTSIPDAFILSQRTSPTTGSPGHIQVTVDVSAAAEELAQKTSASAPRQRRSRRRKPAAASAGPIHVLMALDASGSMSSKAPDVIGGFNGYVETLRADRQNSYRLTVVTFDTNVRTLYADLPLSDVPPLDGTSYRPGGNTALLDAIGVSLDELTAAVRAPEHPYGTERVLVVIMTDGEENSSHRFTKDAIMTRIQARQQAGNWTFVYLGAAADVWMAESLGIHATNTVVFNASVASGSVMGALARSTTQYAASGLSANAAFGRTLDPAALGLPPATDAQAAPATRQPPQQKRGSKSSSKGHKPAPATAP